jgi:hypothetical protein
MLHDVWIFVSLRKRGRRIAEDANSALSIWTPWRPIRLQTTPHTGRILELRRHTILHFPSFVHFYKLHVRPLMHNVTDNFNFSPVSNYRLLQTLGIVGAQ